MAQIRNEVGDHGRTMVYVKFKIGLPIMKEFVEIILTYLLTIFLTINLDMCRKGKCNTPNFYEMWKIEI